MTGEHSISTRRKAVVFGIFGLLFVGLVYGLFGGLDDDDGHVAIDLLSQAGLTTTSLNWSQAPLFVLFGVAAGTLAGMLGMGGGVLKIAGMLLVFQMDIMLARAVSLATMFVATVTAARIHRRKGNLEPAALRPMIVPALVGTIAATVVSTFVSRSTLTHLFAFFVLFLAFHMLAQATIGSLPTPVSRGRLSARLRRACAVIGLTHGFISALLGISGGVVSIPMQQSLIRIPVRKALGNAILLSAWITGVSSTAAIATGLARGDFVVDDLVFTTSCIGAGAWLGSQLGAHLNGKLPTFVLRLLLVQVALSAGLLILFK